MQSRVRVQFRADPTQQSLLLLALLLFLLFRVGVHHQELSISWIPLDLQVVKVLALHEDGALERLHVGDLDWLVLHLVVLCRRPRQIVPYRLDFLHLLLAHAVHLVL